MSSNPPPQGVGDGSLICVGPPLAGLIVNSRGFPSSSHMTHSTCVYGSMRMPSVCPRTLQDFTSLPEVVYWLIVLVLLSVPSFAVTFCQPTKMLLPFTMTESGWLAVVVGAANRQTW